MASIEYPSENVIRAWVRSLRRTDSPLKKYLPHTDEEWFDVMHGVLERAQMFASEDLHAQAARIFHNAVKGHAFVDGNKRSGVIMVYLFYLWNGYSLHERDTGMGESVHEIATQLAAMPGNLTAKEMSALQDELANLAVENVGSLEE